jgi:hypothetical protein
VECLEFRSLLRYLKSDLKESMIPHRTKLRELVINNWRMKFLELKAKLGVRYIMLLFDVFPPCIQDAKGRISVTMDMWSDQNRRSYLAMTAHWITRTSPLQLRTALIAFHRHHGRHDGKTLANVVLQLLDRAGITLKVRVCSLGGITLHGFDFF